MVRSDNNSAILDCASILSSVASLFVSPPSVGHLSYNNTSGLRERGDTVTAHDSGYDAYVISRYGLAVAPADSVNYKSGADSHFVIQGKEFDEWFDALKEKCK